MSVRIGRRKFVSLLGGAAAALRARAPKRRKAELLSYKPFSEFVGKDRFICHRGVL